MERFNWVELAERELKIEQVVGIKRFVRSNEGRVVGIVELIKRERVRGRVKEDFELMDSRDLKVGFRSFEGNGDTPLVMSGALK
ncbi:hypothetical protein Goshw_018506, partial [Gossypium schwendimanii]|nr:hypothetical protein [Gossypium schwendimanii]